MPEPTVLDRFTAQTGITVNSGSGSSEDAAASKTYVADVIGVDWSEVGLYHKTERLMPLNRYFNQPALRSDVPMIDVFTSHGQLLGMPIDSEFLVTTWNTKIASAAGLTAIPQTITQYTQAMRQIKAKGVLAHPLGLSLGEGSGCWYVATAAFGGSVFGRDWAPRFASQDSAGHKALAWMVSAYKSGLVSQPFSSRGSVAYAMADGQVASVLADDAGEVAQLYDIHTASTVVGQVHYIATPGLDGPVPNALDIFVDGVGIPATARNKPGAVQFVRWLTETTNQAVWGGMNGPDELMHGAADRWSSLEMVERSGKVRDAAQLVALLRHARPALPGSIPWWFPQFDEAVTANIKLAATGDETVDRALSRMAARLRSLRGE